MMQKQLYVNKGKCLNYKHYTEQNYLFSKLTVELSFTGTREITRITKHLSVKFRSLPKAEEVLQIDYFTNLFVCNYGADHTSTPRKTADTVQDNLLFPIFSCSPSRDARPLPSNAGDLVQDFILNFKYAMSPRLRTELLSHLLKVTILKSDGLGFFTFVNAVFLQTSLSAMTSLFANNKYKLISY